jgi:hypothetical protein
LVRTEASCFDFVLFEVGDEEFKRRAVGCSRVEARYHLISVFCKVENDKEQ